MGYEINLGNGEWATGQGGMAMTVTDTDTGVKEAVLMGCDRNSNKTAVNKDGLLYDVLPYEPSVTYVDGVGVLNNEPQATNIITYSEDFSQWNSSSSGLGDSVIVTPNNSISPTGLNDATKLDFNLNGGNTASDVSQLILLYNATSGQELTSSIWIKSADTNDYTIALDSDSQQGNLVVATNEWQRLDTKRTGANTGSRTFKIGLRGSFGTSDSASVLVYGAQLEAGSLATSYIPTNGATQTRLADTGFKTPDISKWIDGSDFIVEFSFKDLGASSSRRRLTLSDGSTSNRFRITKEPLGTLSVNFDIGGVSSVVAMAISSTPSQDFVLKIGGKSGSYFASIDGVDFGNSTNSVALGVDDIKFLVLAEVNDTLSFDAKIKSIKITS